MLQLVYISTAREPITPAMCDSILAASRRNNRAAGISGLLVAGRTRFLQALEGPTDAVRHTYARIIADQRHFACVLLGERYADVAQFGAWAMGYSQGGDSAGDTSLESIVAALVAPIEDANLRAHFTGFAALQARAA